MMPFDSPASLESSIQFHQEDVSFDFPDAAKVIDWLQQAIQTEQQQLNALQFIFCSDPYLHQINLDYLQHDTYTDVITFPYSDTHVEGDIFISIDRIHDNAKLYKTDFSTELRRVMVHGVLHLCGYGDKTEEEAKQMRAKEDEYLGKYS